MSQSKQYTVDAPRVAGLAPTTQGSFATLKEAKEFASEKFGHRGDLKGQDVVIYQDGVRVCYAGPCR